MTERGIFWDVRAKESLKNIFYYLKSKASVDTATRVRNKLIQEVKSIVLFPEKGALEPNLKTLEGEFRFKIVWSYKIIYEVRSERIYILDIFHTSRNPVDIKKE